LFFHKPQVDRQLPGLNLLNLRADLNGGMNRGIYALASGMLATQQQMDVIANNLANASTTGFKSDELLFNEALERSMSSAANPNLGSLGIGAMVKQQHTDLTQGALNETHNPTDLAIQGDAMFAVQDVTGRIRYTRDGSFTAQADGTLVTKQGYKVLDPGLQPVQIRPGVFTVGADGSVSNPTSGTPYAQIGMFSGAAAKAGDGSYDLAAPAQAAGSKITQGALETSNVNAINTMTQMITLGRNFDLAQKSMQSEDDMTQRLATILS
jgi:flagellar basal body rod protein FlgG